MLAPFVQRGGWPLRLATLQLKEPDSPPEETELRLVAPPTAGALRTDSQNRRLAPVNPLKRKRRSRKLRKATVSDDRFVPLVKGARESTSESILKAYQVPAELDKQQRAGEDYYVDPQLLMGKMESERSALAAAKKFKKGKGMFSADKLKEEIVAPYKNNIIGAIVVGIGTLAVVYVLQPVECGVSPPLRHWRCLRGLRRRLRTPEGRRGSSEGCPRISTPSRPSTMRGPRVSLSLSLPLSRYPSVHQPTGGDAGPVRVQHRRVDRLLPRRVMIPSHRAMPYDAPPTTTCPRCSVDVIAACAFLAIALHV